MNEGSNTGNMEKTNNKMHKKHKDCLSIVPSLTFLIKTKNI